MVGEFFFDLGCVAKQMSEDDKITYRLKHVISWYLYPYRYVVSEVLTHQRRLIEVTYNLGFERNLDESNLEGPLANIQTIIGELFGEDIWYWFNDD